MTHSPQTGARPQRPRRPRAAARRFLVLRTKLIRTLAQLTDTMFICCTVAASRLCAISRRMSGAASPMFPGKPVNLAGVKR